MRVKLGIIGSKSGTHLSGIDTLGLFLTVAMTISHSNEEIWDSIQLKSSQFGEVTFL